MACIIFGLSLLNLCLWILQTAFYGRKIAKTEIREAPIFVLGHWRSGTTLLHEFLAMDPRHTYPDTYACFMSNHFLISARLFKGWAGLLLPSRRPMDNMTIAWDRPQEDEWAMCNMGIPSPYLWLIFCNRPRPYQEYLDLRNVPPNALEKWKRAFVWFLKCLTVQNPKRIVLKSPQHTCRIRVLLDLFPDARFVHITRDPFVIFPSTMKTWKRLAAYHGLQRPNQKSEKDWKEFVFSTFNHMHQVILEDRHLVDPSHFYEIRYEDLVADPVGQMEALYSHLHLGDFEPARHAIETYMANHKDYQISQYDLTEEARREISERWGAYRQQYGYGGATD
ncbi:MAG: sulfotransferase [Pirellulales bacterium]|nr:sulfotransferase [Pirellulales bacterium]